MRRGTISGQNGLVALPLGVFRVKKPRGKTYWYYQARRGKPDKGPLVRMPEFGTPEFRLEYAKLTKPSGSSPRSPKYNVSALVSDFKAQPGWAARRPNTITTYEGALGHILHAWGERSPKAISISHVLALMQKHADRPSMANLVLVLVRQLMKLAVQKGLRSDNPAREVDFLTEAGDGAKPLSDDACAALTSGAAPDALRRLAILGHATGQRISDLVRMSPADRDAEGLNVTITKLGGKPHWCPLRPEEAATIDAWDVPTGLTYIHAIGGKKYSEDQLRLIWNAYAATEAGAPIRGFTPHDLRATKVCDERIRGRTHQQIAAMVGMSLQMVMKYSARIDQRLVAGGTPAVTAPAGPLGRIYTSQEAATYLRITHEMIAGVAKDLGLGSLFGQDLRFKESDILAIWDACRCACKDAPNPAP
jgi:integrase